MKSRKTNDLIWRVAIRHAKEKKMDMILNTVMKSINGEFILSDGMEQNCESGAAALDSIDFSGVYDIQKIGVNDGKVYIEVCDQTEVIAQQNSVWIETEKARNGAEPSFF